MGHPIGEKDQVILLRRLSPEEVGLLELDQRIAYPSREQVQSTWFALLPGPADIPQTKTRISRFAVLQASYIGWPALNTACLQLRQGT